MKSILVILLKERFWLGAFVRSLNTLALIGQMKVNDLINVGLLYGSLINSKDISQIGNTFELMLKLNLSFFHV